MEHSAAAFQQYRIADTPVFALPVREFRRQVAVKSVVYVAGLVHGARFTASTGLAFISSFQ